MRPTRILPVVLVVALSRSADGPDLAASLAELYLEIP
jgi:hypothetical protein